MVLRIEIEKLLTSLESAPLLKNVGTAIHDKNIVRISSWDDLAEESARINYVASHQTLVYFIVDHLSGAKCDEFEDAWRERVVLEIRPRVRALAKPLANLIPLPKSAVKEIVEQIGDDILAACQEIECEETSSTYFRETMEWFLRGHLPCGREGEACDGNRIVF